MRPPLVSAVQRSWRSTMGSVPLRKRQCRSRRAMVRCYTGVAQPDCLTRQHFGKTDRCCSGRRAVAAYLSDAPRHDNFFERTSARGNTITFAVDYRSTTPAR